MEILLILMVNFYGYINYESMWMIVLQ